MDGIIIDPPIAKLIINGERKYDFRKSKPPNDKKGVPLYLITDDFVLGEIMITLARYNQLKHCYYWEYRVMKKYPKSKKIINIFKNGDWGKDIDIGE